MHVITRNLLKNQNLNLITKNLFLNNSINKSLLLKTQPFLLSSKPNFSTKSSNVAKVSTSPVSSNNSEPKSITKKRLTSSNEKQEVKEKEKQKQKKEKQEVKEKEQKKEFKEKQKQKGLKQKEKEQKLRLQQKLKEQKLKQRELKQKEKEKKEQQKQLVKEKKAAKPKRNPTAFILYLQQVLPILKEQNSELKQTEILKIAGTNWSTLSPELKQKYIDQSELSKVKYLEEKANYQQKYEPPKRKLSPYNNFLKSEFPNVKIQNPQASLTECSAIIAKRWKSLTNEQKDQFKI
eukprot:TRINITY_DN523_c1_g1_i1.p1 TRINITY_DN523_c1_g1~~TRINITY_DN523_c1_g1_i1.p1  ORF type:complete len:292 (-),score=142.67 TRINITY_DN523_c1_g1_i1:154-1029(-)